jgi:hypothetical protein
VSDDGGPAFPNNDQNGCAFAGMTLRDWFAGQALAGMLDRAYGIPVNVIAKRSYEMADAMLAAREGNQTETN